MQTSISLIVEESAGIDRCNEPVTFGLPLTRGLAGDGGLFLLFDQNGISIPLQTKALAYWPDKSIKWLLLDFQASVHAGAVGEFRLEVNGSGKKELFQRRINSDETAEHFRVDTGAASFFINKSIFLPFKGVRIDGNEILNPDKSNTLLLDSVGQEFSPYIKTSQFETKGPLRTTLKLAGDFKSVSGEVFAAFISRLHFYVDKALAHIEFTLLNPKAAKHPGGLWDLGDPGSILFQDLSLGFGMLSPKDSRIICRIHEEEKGLSSPKIIESAMGFQVYQDSSGGENWQSLNHVNRNNEVRHSFRGFKVLEGDFLSHEGLRANPVMTVADESVSMTGVMRYFWQNFPKAMEAENDKLIFRLFPAQYNDEHELQGGEQKTHSLYIDFRKYENNDSAYEWPHSPLLPRANSEWYASTKAIPYFISAGEYSNNLLQGLINTVVEGDNTFFYRRELIDEYGWRNFGELYADHEAVGSTGPYPRVSHYNNQYDAINGMLLQFLRSGDMRWYQLADQLCLHVKDIDIYHTDEDRPEFNNGMFWHTEHYLDVETATHRCFSKRHADQRDLSSYGGGPSLSHNYSSGLFLHYYMTGSMSSKDAVLQLGAYVMNNIAMAKTISNKLLKITRKIKLKVENVVKGEQLVQHAKVYGLDGPGRGSGNSLNSLLDSYVLTGDKKLLDASEELIARCISPCDKIEERDLLDIENRWMYTVFLQSLGKYLDLKSEMASFDEMWDYSKKSLTHYAVWMAENENLYLEMMEKLEFPNETWAAQELRKSAVFMYAEKYSSADLRQLFLEKASFFFSNSMKQLDDFDTKFLTRPIIILLQNYGMCRYLIWYKNRNLEEHAVINYSANKGHSASNKILLEVVGKDFSFSLSDEIQFIKWRFGKR